MNIYRIWLKDDEPQSVEIEAESREDARDQVRQMLDDGTFWEKMSPEFTESSWEITEVEAVE